MDKRHRSDIGSKIRFCRLNCGLSQKQVGNALGVGRSTIGSWENSRTQPKPDDIVKLAQIFRVDATEILPSENITTKLKDIKSDENSLKPIYSLTKQEQQLLLSFRILNDDDKAKILAKITKLSQPD